MTALIGQASIGLLVGWAGLIPGDRAADSPPRADTLTHTAEIVLTLGDEGAEPDGFFVRIAGISVAEDGRFAVLDRGMSRVRVYAPDGHLLFGAGREGRGPGELSRDAVAAAFDEAGNLVVADPENARLTTFDRSGAVIATHPLDRTGRVVSWTPVGRGRVMERIWRTRGDHLRLRDLPDGVGEALLDFEHPAVAEFGAPPTPIELLGVRPVWTVTSGGHLAWAYAGPGFPAEVHLLRVTGTSADTRSFMVPTHAAHPLARDQTARLRTEALRGLAEAFGRSPEEMRSFLPRFTLPDSLPGITGLFAGPDGTLLVQGAASPEELDGLGLFSFLHYPLGGDRWTLLGEDGSFLGLARLPARFLPFAASGELLFGVQRDEWDVERVLVIRLVPDETTSVETAPDEMPPSGEGSAAAGLPPRSGRAGAGAGRSPRPFPDRHPFP